MLFDACSGAVVANYVGAEAPIHVSRPTASLAPRGLLTLNARAHLDPEVLRSVVEEAIAHVFPVHGVTARLGESAHFRPGRPVPTHRFGPG